MKKQILIGILFFKGWSEFDGKILINLDEKVINEYEFRDGYYLGIDDIGVCDSFYYLKFKKGVPVMVGNEYLDIDNSWYVSCGV